jgi:hypothetical protein
MTRTLTTLTAATALVLGSGLAAATPALARGGDAIRAHGQCSGNATWKLKASHDDGLVEVEFEVDSNVNGQSWAVRLRDNGDRFFRGTRTTQPPSGSFTVHRRTANRAGSDFITARATHGTQVCRGHVTV